MGVFGGGAFLYARTCVHVCVDIKQADGRT